MTQENKFVSLQKQILQNVLYSIFMNNKGRSHTLKDLNFFFTDFAKIIQIIKLYK